MPIRITEDLAECSSSFSTMDKAILWAANNGAKIINLSYSGVYRPTAKTIADQVRAKGALYVQAAGNNGQSLQSACSSDGFTSTECNQDPSNLTIVGSTDQNDFISYFSNYGAGVDLYAPGESLYTAVPEINGSYDFVYGTSFSAPVVSGSLALLASAFPQLPVGSIESILVNSGLKLIQTEAVGKRRMNLYQAFLKAIETMAALVNKDNKAAFALAGACSGKGLTKSVSVADANGKVLGLFDCRTDGKWDAKINLSTYADGFLWVQITHNNGTSISSKVRRRLFKSSI